MRKQKKSRNFAPEFAVCVRVKRTYARMNMIKRIFHNVALLLSLLMTLCFAFVFVGEAEAQAQAGITMADATWISQPTTLRVQSGYNYIRLPETYLMATVTYLPDSAFGPIPSLLVDGAEWPVQRSISNCRRGWQWQLHYGDTESEVLILSAHENALIEVTPVICPADSLYEAEAWDSLTWRGQTYYESNDYLFPVTKEGGCNYTVTLRLTIHHTLTNILPEHACDSFMLNGVKFTTDGDYVRDTVPTASGDREVNIIRLTIGHTDFAEETREACVEYVSGSGKIYTVSGDYLDTVPNLEGCNTIVTLHLTVIPDCRTYDTVYFCAGLNTQHEEQIGDLVHRYLPYRYESPTVWDYMDGVILATEKERTLVDLVRAEQNLREHYSGDLTPVQTIRWTVHYEGEDGYQSLEAGNGPQWIRPGMIVLYVQFVCGEQYRSNFATDIVAPEAMTTAVKRMENGRVVIFRGGEKYTVLGIKID